MFLAAEGECFLIKESRPVPCYRGVKLLPNVRRVVNCYIIKGNNHGYNIFRLFIYVCMYTFYIQIRRNNTAIVKLFY